MNFFVSSQPTSVHLTIFAADLRPTARLVARARLQGAPGPVLDAMAATVLRFPAAEWHSVDLEFGPDGSPGMLWRNDRAYAYIDILPNGRIHYYYESESGASAESVVGAAHELPIELGQAIAAATSDSNVAATQSSPSTYYPSTIAASGVTNQYVTVGAA